MRDGYFWALCAQKYPSLNTSYVWQRLTYLIAAGYELEGKPAEAVENYLAVMRAEPQTIWGNMAAMHLKLK